MLAISEPELTKILHSLDHHDCNLLLQQLSTALGAFTAQRKQEATTQKKKKNRLNNIHQPPRTSIVSEQWQSTTLFMPVSDNQSTGLKIVTVPKVSSATNGIRGVINILSPEGCLEGVLSAAEITAFRTALASMIPFRRWMMRNILSSSNLNPQPHPGPRRGVKILIFGSGKQAEWHARLALLAGVLGDDNKDAREIEEITFVNRSQERLDSSVLSSLVPDLRQRYPHLTTHAYSREAPLQDGRGVDDTADAEEQYQSRLRADLASADAIFCCTPSTTPLFTYEDLTALEPQRRRFISLIGSYKPHMQEIDSKTLLSGAQGGKIYVDSVEACMAEAGELIMAKVKEEQLIELGELYSSSFKDEEEDDDNDGVTDNAGGNVVFKCVGLAIMDLVIARSLLDIAKRRGLGTFVEGF